MMCGFLLPMMACSIVILLQWIHPTHGLLTASSTFVGRSLSPTPPKPGQERHRHHPPHSMTMRDHSASYWFNVGDSVTVVDDVLKAGESLKGQTGRVVETWEKCDVDPTCCCAEQVDEGMAVRVQFSDFTHYFAEDELLKAVDDNKKEAVLPFDGMSCTAFKLDQLKVESKPRRIGSYDPSSSS